MKSSKLDIQQYNVDDPFCENINDPLLEANVKYRNHPSIVAIKTFCNLIFHLKIFKRKKFLKN